MRALAVAVALAVLLAGCSQRSDPTADDRTDAPPGASDDGGAAPAEEGAATEKPASTAPNATSPGTPSAAKRATVVFDWTFTGTDPRRTPTGTNCGTLSGNTTWLGGTLTARLEEGFTPDLRMRFTGPDGAETEGTGAGDIEIPIPATNTTWNEPAQIVIHLARAGSEPVAAHVRISATFDYLGEQPKDDTSPTHLSMCTLPPDAR